MRKHQLKEICPKCRNPTTAGKVDVLQSAHTPDTLFDECVSLTQSFAVMPPAYRNKLDCQEREIVDGLVKVIYVSEMRTMFNFEIQEKLEAPMPERPRRTSGFRAAGPRV